MHNKILVVDDDLKLTSLLATYLGSHGYDVAVAHDGSAMFSKLSSFKPDLIILDLMLPGDDGLVLCKKIRLDSSVPIIMLTARGNDVDRIIGLETGADDYLPKPFSPRELVARIKSVLRRVTDTATQTNSNTIKRLKFADWILDLGSYNLINTSGVVTILSAGEFKLLRLFVENPNKILSRDQLMESLAGHDISPTDRTIDVMISRLRRRLNDNPKEPALIITVRSEGYKLASDVICD
ncbi:response regulator [Tolumonas lignilytica]|jgi:Response regulators consisting of a CheY-like receiver domain and a winged-helix DNA-binding domain|uniref:response regulator n=1 Tax=Tolumonas lignilytica TaxID=1283284 RepID=UPI000465FCDC|nr:response regulator [Tolumonas lignilytica]